MKTEIKEISLGKLHTNRGQIPGLPSNPRFIKDNRFDALKKSLQDDPEMTKLRELIVIDHEGKYVIVGGNMRYRAMKDLGWKSAPCKILPKDTPAEKLRAYAIKDNVAFGQDDYDMLANEWDLEELNSFGFEMPDQTEIEEEEELKAEEDDYTEAEAEQVPPRAKVGDIFQLGKHRLMCGDSTDKEQIKKLMNGKLADMWLTDPPYNVNYEGTNGLKIMNDSMENEKFRAFLADAYKAADSVMQPGAAFYIWHADSEGFNFRAAAFAAKWKVRQCLVWKKQHFVIGRQDYQWKHESCLYGWKEGAIHYFCNSRKETTIINEDQLDYDKMTKQQLLEFIKQNLQEPRPTSVIDYDKPQKSREHPTMKPVGLFGYLMQNSSRIGDRILDSFGGSGTTIIAAEQLGRVAYVMEFDPHYVDVICDRYEKLTGKQAIKIN